jgi:hypothetical protein
LSFSVAWDEPDGKPHAVLLLTHGAGGDYNDAFLKGVATGLAAKGIAVARFNLAYRDAGRRSPGSQKRSEESYRSIATELRRDGLPLYCGGKSYGGRIATHVVADGFDVTGLVLLSYPLHPPGRPERLRDAHLKPITVPMLFCQGTRDPFATPELLDATIGALENAKLSRIDGGDHSLRVRGRKPQEVYAAVTEAIADFIEADADR